MEPKCVCVYKYNYFMRLTNPSQMKKGYEQQKIPQSGICPAPCVHRQSTVIFAWKYRIFCLCAHVQCHICYIFHVEFHFRFRRLLSFTVKHQLWSGCHGERSSKKISGNFLRGGEGGRCFWGMGQFLRLS